MRLDPFVRDYRTYMDEFVEALNSRGTHFYLDTSVLMWLIRIGADARNEFISWCRSRPDKTVRVPVWAAHELHRHVVGGTVRQNVQKTLDEVRAKYDEFARLAVERADEAVCRTRGFAGRANYVGEVEQTLSRLNNLATVVSTDDRQLCDATDEVIGFVNERLLETDIGPLLERLSHTGDFRYSHFVPPGFQDKKDENRYGDVIIWEEIVANLIAVGPDGDGKPRHAILISRDKKTDWVSSAPLVRNGDGSKPEKPNRDLEFDVTLPIPLLGHEFSSRAKGNRLYVSHPGFLASAIDFAARRQGETSGVKQWLAALHRPTFLERLAALKLVPSTTTTAAPPSSAEAAPQPAPPPSDAESEATQAAGAVSTTKLSTDTAIDVMKISVADDVLKFEQLLPTDQPAQIESWVLGLKGGELSPYKLGRIFAALSIKGIPGWSERLPSLINELRDVIGADGVNALVLAVISSAYFDQHGDLLTRPWNHLGTVVLALEDNPLLEPAFHALRRFLAAADAKLPYVPGSKQKIHFAINLVIGTGNEARTIQDIRVGEQSAFADPSPSDSPRLLSKLLGRSPTENCTGQELRSLIASEYLIPLSCLKSDLDSKKLTWAPNAGLVTLDTGSEGGLSTLAEDEESYD